LEQDNSFLNRKDMKVFTAATNEDALKIHRAERVNLIITQLDMPGMPSEQFCSLIRDDANLRSVSMIMVCANTPEAIARSAQCRANAVLLQPVHPLLLMVKAQQLLDVAVRETLRVLLTANIDTHFSNGPFYCCSRNVSATGMLIETETALIEGARLSCLFYLPDAQKIQATGKIVRTIERAPGDDLYQYGLMFTDITPKVKKILENYVNKTSHT
jgi:DNA-binding response OmpR family regulator